MDFTVQKHNIGHIFPKIITKFIMFRFGFDGFYSTLTQHRPYSAKDIFEFGLALLPE